MAQSKRSRAYKYKNKAGHHVRYLHNVHYLAILCTFRKENLLRYEKRLQRFHYNFLIIVRIEITQCRLTIVCIIVNQCC